jgi:DNA-binding transcriptional MerR regulator
MQQATFRIGEVADQLGVSIAALRIWEQRGLIPRARRHPNGRRFYSPQDLEAIKHWWL